MGEHIILVLVVIKDRCEGFLKEGVRVYGVFVEKLKRIVEEVQECLLVNLNGEFSVLVDSLGGFLAVEFPKDWQHDFDVEVDVHASLLNLKHSHSILLSQFLLVEKIV